MTPATNGGPAPFFLCKVILAHLMIHSVSFFEPLDLGVNASYHIFLGYDSTHCHDNVKTCDAIP